MTQHPRHLFIARRCWWRTIRPKRPYPCDNYILHFWTFQVPGKFMLDALKISTHLHGIWLLAALKHWLRCSSSEVTWEGNWLQLCFILSPWLASLWADCKKVSTLQWMRTTWMTVASLWTVKSNWKRSNWFAVLSGQDRATAVDSAPRTLKVSSFCRVKPSWSLATENPFHVNKQSILEPLDPLSYKPKTSTQWWQLGCRPEYLVAGKPFFWHKTWVSLKTTMTRRWKIKTMHENVAPTNNGGFPS